MQSSAPAKITNGDSGVGVAVIVPTVGAAHFQGGAGFVVKFSVPLQRLQFGGEIIFVAEKHDAFEGVPAAHVAWDESGLWPVRHENRAGKAAGVEGILDDVNVCRWMRESIGDDAGHEKFVWWVEVGRQRSREADDDAIGRKIMNEIGVKAMALQKGPGLKNPCLGAGNFSLFFQNRIAAFAPSDLIFLTGQKGAGQIKGNAHELSKR